MTPNSLVITFSRPSSDSSGPSVDKFSNQTVVSAADSSSGGKEPISVSISDPKLSSVQQRPVFDTPADREMATILNQARTKTVQIHHKGAKDGVKIRLPGAGSASKDIPSQSVKQQTGYIITPSGANAGENIAINGGGLVIRARNDKRQTVTARSTPDNQLQVQVGQGKSAVQLSIQVTPQGTRGEVELQCVRNAEEEGGTTGYTVSVKRPEDESRAYKQNHRTRSPERSKSPSDRRAFALGRSEGARERREGSPDRGRSSPERAECSQKQSRKFPERPRNNSTPYRQRSPVSYASEARYSRNEAFPTYPDERPASHHGETRSHVQAQARNASPMRAPKQTRELQEYVKEDDADLHYKRKLDTHHHKPTISYLIARRMTELFKEMRKTAEMHPPAPPFVKF